MSDRVSQQMCFHNVHTFNAHWLEVTTGSFGSCTSGTGCLKQRLEPQDESVGLVGSRVRSDLKIALPVPNLTDVTLVYHTCKNANWKLVNVDEERINDSLVEKLKFGQDIKAEFFVTFFSWSLVQTWSTGFSQDFEIEIWPIFWGWCLLEIWQFLSDPSPIIVYPCH